MPELERWQVRIFGLVQGVGMRPFLYNLAQKHQLTGWVRNEGGLVELEIQGKSEQLQKWWVKLRAQAPAAAVIDRIDSVVISIISEANFVIIPSASAENGGAPLPDQAICASCEKEFFTPSEWRYQYPFNSCTQCGPRFTITEKLPFDRERTSMKEFQLCVNCQAEYLNPIDRRFHAQTIACEFCGPKLKLKRSKGEVSTEDPAKLIQLVLKKGGIIGIKGIGGYHLVCDATQASAVTRLRDLKGRDQRAFAVMFRDLATLATVCEVSAEAAELLTSPMRPILLLPEKKESPIAQGVKPGLTELGAFLPYTGVHFLLFSEEVFALVMTSGNHSGAPLIHHDGEAEQQLLPKVDLLITHNREIRWRCDDSVLRIQRGRIIGLRRSRGFVPAPVRISRKLPPLLACGAQQKNVFALAQGETVYLSQHQGDLDERATWLEYQNSIQQWQRLLRITPEYVIHDLHPEYNSTLYAKSTGLKRVAVQHHLAHLASVIALGKVTGEVIGVIADGSGYGVDGKLWGGEFFAGSGVSWRRMGHLAYTPMPGGETAVHEPWRMTAAYLEKVAPEILAPWLARIGYESKWQMIRTALGLGINAPETSSLGRLFDGMAALLGAPLQVSYEGEAAIWLENQAERSNQAYYHFEYEIKDATYLIQPGMVIAEAWQELKVLTPGMISMKFHQGLAVMIGEIVGKIRQETGYRQVILAGGVFQNRLLLDLTWELLEKKGFQVSVPEIVPINDGGIALGQAWLGSLMIEEGIVDVLGSTRSDCSVR